MTPHWRTLLAFLSFTVFLAPAAAQYPPEGAVTGQGLVEIKRQPNTLRIQVEVMAKGRDLKEALTKLKERREAVKQQLAALGAAKDALAFGEPSAGSGKTDRQRELERMIGERIRKTAKKDAKPKEPAPVVASVWLKAELPLKAESVEELLIAFEGLQEKIKAADLGGTKQFEKMTPEEEEAAEEDSAPSRYMRGEEEPKRGEPMFIFVRKLTDDERDKALAEAFRKAKKDAERLARAAGADLGALQHLGGQNSGAAGFDMQEMYDPYSSRRFRQMREAFGGDYSADQQAQEAVGSQPGKVVYRVMVSASFALTPAKK